MFDFLMVTLKNIFSLNEKSRAIDDLQKEVQELKIKQESFKTSQRILENIITNSKKEGK